MSLLCNTSITIMLTTITDSKKSKKEMYVNTYNVVHSMYIYTYVYYDILITRISRALT
jgi:hypothetical protein